MTTFARLAKILTGEVAPKNWIENAFKGVVDAIASAVAGNVPTIGDSDVGKFLRANSDKTPGWVKIYTVPSIGQADKGKILYAGQNLKPQWGNKEVPTVGENDKDKYLHTNSTTGDVEWSALTVDTGLFDVDFTIDSRAETATSTKTAQEIFAALSAGKTLRGRFIVESGSTVTIAGVVHGSTANNMFIYSIPFRDGGNNVSVASIRWYNDAWSIAGFGPLA